MIIGRNRLEVIKNIKRSAECKDFYAKVEIDDPVLTSEQSNEIVKNYIKSRTTRSFKIKSFFARTMANILTFALNRKTEIVGIEKLKGIKGGAMITSNHFSPIENTAIRHLVKKLGKKRLNIVCQETNLAMTGAIGFLMNYGDTIPICENVRYMQRDFTNILSELVENDEYVLIYPEKEMWFNYRKPREFKRGAYYYAARLNVPVISCFVEMQDLPERDKGDFNKVKYTVHILDVMYPDINKTVKENSVEMCKKDYELKKSVYEKVYGKPLTYTFEKHDIAGWTGVIDF